LETISNPETLRPDYSATSNPSPVPPTTDDPRTNDPSYMATAGRNVTDTEVTLSYGDSFAFNDGLVVTVASPEAYVWTGSQTAYDLVMGAMPEGSSVVVFVVSVTNGSESNWDSSGFMPNVFGGSIAGIQMIDSNYQHPNPNADLAPSESLTFGLIYAVEDPAVAEFKLTTVNLGETMDIKQPRPNWVH
jgi:hypothetical protein